MERVPDRVACSDVMRRIVRFRAFVDQVRVESTRDSSDRHMDGAIVRFDATKSMDENSYHVHHLRPSRYT